MNKKRYLSLTLIIALSVVCLMPFNNVKAMSQQGEFGFNEGFGSYLWSTDGTSFEFAGYTYTVQSAFIVDIHLNDYYYGDFVFTANSDLSDLQLFVIGEGVSGYTYSADGKTWTFHINNINGFKVIYCTSGTMQQKWINSTNNTLSTTPTDNTVISTTDKIKNARLTVFGSPNKSATADVLSDHYIYVSGFTSSYTMNRIDMKFNYSELVNGNYMVFTFYILSGHQYTPADFGQDLFVRNHNNQLFNISSSCYKDLFITWNSTNGNGVYLITYYVPIALLTSSTYLDQGDWQFSTYTFNITDVIQVGWIYRGIVENVPDSVLKSNDQTSQDITDVTEDLSDVTSQIDDIEGDIYDLFDDNITNIDLDDYDFFDDLTNTTLYFKTYIDNVFTNLGDFKALFIVPVICTILMIMIGWVF